MIANPVPDNLSDLSGWSRDQLQAGLNNVDTSKQATSLLSWYVTTPACIQAYTASAVEPARYPSAAPVRGLW